MRYFEEFTSNTLAGSANQAVFSLQPEETRIGRVFYQIHVPGTFRYSILFSNILDSTFSDGSLCNCNQVLPSWQILQLRVGKCSHLDAATFQLPGSYLPESGKDCPKTQLEQVKDFVTLTFEGKQEKTVAPGEFFSTDPVELTFEEGEYLCLETTVQGSLLPYHEESILPAYVWKGDGWQYDRRTIFAGMIGCDRKVKSRIAFCGDSITQGIGTPVDSYTHWNAVVSQMLGTEYSYWNLGIGFGRANDFASNGAWMYKGTHTDYAVVCYGVNDLSRKPEAQIRQDLKTIVEKLKKAGVRVLLQTIPPFDYQGEMVNTWKRLNSYVLEEVAPLADGLFDVVPVLGAGPDQPEKAVYGGHPDETGCRVWAEALYPAMKKLLEAE